MLSNLCPGVPINTLFNQKRTSLFFDRPFQNKKQCNDVDNTNVVIRDIDYNRVWDDTKIDYTLRKIIEDFPQYSISEGLDNNEEWAHEVIAYYLNAAEKGNTQCYNNIGVLKSLCNCLSDDSNDINSERNKEIVSFFTLASKGGDVNAMINLASLYMLLKIIRMLLTIIRWLLIMESLQVHILWVLFTTLDCMATQRTKI